MAESLEMQAFNVQAANAVQAAHAVQAANLDTFHVDLKIDSESKYYGCTQYGFTRNDVFFFSTQALFKCQL